MPINHETRYTNIFPTAHYCMQVLELLSTTLVVQVEQSVRCVRLCLENNVRTKRPFFKIFSVLVFDRTRVNFEDQHHRSKYTGRKVVCRVLCIAKWSLLNAECRLSRFCLHVSVAPRQRYVETAHASHCFHQSVSNTSL